MYLIIRETIQDNEIAMRIFYKGLKMDPNFTDARYSLGYTYNYTDRQKAIDQYQVALDFAMKLDDKNAIMKIKRMMGDIYSDQYETDRALSFLRDAYKLSKEIGNKKRIASAMSGLGSFFERRVMVTVQDIIIKTLMRFTRILEIKKVGITINIGLVHWLFDNNPDSKPSMILKKFMI